MLLIKGTKFYDEYKANEYLFGQELSIGKATFYLHLPGK